MLETIAAFLAGMIVGILIAIIRYSKIHYSGTLRVDRSDDEPMLFLDLDDDIQTISANSEVIFRVENHDVLPHE